MICGTLARIGNEVYELQRPEIGELREPTTGDTVGSITMPHKRNPEGSEHLDTLARLVRANAAVLTEGMVVGHERDGRGWKAEWVALPEVCLLTGVALAAGPAPAVRAWSSTSTTMRANLDQSRRPAGVRADPRRADPEAGQARRPAAHARRARAGQSRRRIACSTRWCADGCRHGAGPRGWTTLGGGRRRRDGRRRRRPGAAARAAEPDRMAHEQSRGSSWPLLPTPLVRAPRLERALDAGPIFVKRDDLTGFGDRRQQGAGPGVPARRRAAPRGPTSSSPAAARRRTSVRPPPMAARVVGLDCDLLFPGDGARGPVTRTSSSPGPPVRGCCSTRSTTRDLLDDAVVEHADDLRARGPSTVRRAAGRGDPGRRRSATPWPRGSSAEQCDRPAIAARTVVVATGSGGTQAGLVAGQVGLRPAVADRSAPVVSRPAAGMAERTSFVWPARCAACSGLDAADR